MSRNHKHKTVRNWLHRGFAGLLCLVMVLGLLPGTALLTVSAEDEEEEVMENWATPYMEQLVGWGVMRGDIDGNLYPERSITRAEFVTMMNRAYGYDEMGGNPFVDVLTQDWFYDDIDIAYNVGYFLGSSSNTATPNGDLTREQAAVLLARNMMLRGSSGETLGFSDSRELSEWSRGLVGAASDSGVINGYEDGSFRPQNNITRGEVASMLTRAVGTLVNQPGSVSLGSVYGNVTINSSDVSLRNTTIVGNLYLTGGIGLGDVLLENVDVYGEIIVAGAGESNSSQSSVVMRNVTANSLIVDNISNQFVTVRAEGDTRIATTSVRTNAYVEDTTANGFGLSYIELDGEPGSRLQLAGNIKEVKNLTPMSSLEIVQGSAAKVTADEKATDSSIRIESGARVDELDLDVGARVDGDGDIGSMNVGAAGTNVSILPDDITVRPGITSNVAGTQMDNVTAAESSSDPRLLSGYPAVRSIAPNSATLVFSTNKAGTVYWAVSALADGSVNEDDLITNPAYGGNVFRSGRINAVNSKTEYTAQVTGLTVDGWYYVSALLVDARGNHSPLKVTAFSTPDNTTPAFTAGYPVMTKNTTKTAQVTVMTNKSCQLFYALLPNNAAAPTAQEFKTGAVSGNLGYGVVDVVKSNTTPINVNSVTLEELTNYSLYLWLNDYDNARSSAVRRVNFTTPDETPPVVTDIMQTNAAAASVDLSYTLNETGTLYWAIVPEGDTTFMNYELDTMEAKVKVEAGYSALKRGSSTASRADTAIRLAISGLNSRTTGTTSYDVYYIAKDRAGNYADKVGKINVRTLDTDAPTVTQRFTKYNDDNTAEPLADTDVELVFSESVQGGSDGRRIFMNLYNAVIDTAAGPEAQNAAREALANALREHIKLYRVPMVGQATQVTERTKDNQSEANLNWTIDYRFATVRMEEGKMIISFPTFEESGEPRSALNLDSGATYYFHVEGIYDNALTPNAMGGRDLPQFRTVFARVSLSMGSSQTLEDLPAAPENNKANRIDFNFVVDPISVDRVDDDMRWDMLIWTDMLMEYTLYYRYIDANNRPVTGDRGKWKKLNDEPFPMPMESSGLLYKSYTTNFLRANEQRPDLDKLNSMEKMEFAIHIDSMGVDSNKNFSAWNYNVTFRVSIMAGEWNTLLGLANGSTQTDYNNGITAGAVPIGTPDPFERRVPFTDSEAPVIGNDWPILTDLSDVGAKIDVMLDRPGSVYYILFPVSSMITDNNAALNNATTELTEDRLQTVKDYSTPVGVTGGRMTNGDEFGVNVKPRLGKIPRVGESADGRYMPAEPVVNLVTNGTFVSNDVIKGATNSVIANTTTTIDLTNKLSPNTTYLICMVTRGTSAVYSKEVLCYRFTTKEAMRPELDLFVDGSTARITTDRNTDWSYFLVRKGYESAVFKEMFSRRTDTNWKANDSTVGGSDGYFWVKETRDASGKVTAYQYSEKNGNLNFESTMPLEQMTVLDAMDIRCYDGGTYCGSVFDMYATTEAKNELASLIQGSRSSGTNGIVKNGSGSSPAGEIPIDCSDKMQALQEYAFICVGKSAQGSGYSFRAFYPMTLSDTNPPMVNIVTVSGSAKADPDNPKFGVFDEGARIIVTFSEPLYLFESGMAYPLDNCKTNNGHEGTDYRGIGTLTDASTGGTIRTVGNHKNAKPVDQIEFALDEGARSAQLAIRAPLVDKEGNGSQRYYDEKSLLINISITPFASTYWDETTGTLEVVYTYGIDVQIEESWNGTGGIWKSIGQS